MTGNVRSFLSFSKLFFHFARWRFFILAGAMALSGVFESVGIVLFFPLLEQLQGGIVAQSGIVGAIAWALNVLHLNSLGGILFIISLVFFLKFLAIFGQEWTVQMISRNLFRKLSQQLINGISRADYAQVYLRTTTGSMSNVLTRELPSFLTAFVHYAGTFVSIFYILLYLAVLFTLETRITIFSVIAGCIIMAMQRSFSRLTRTYAIELTAHSARYQTGVIEFMQSYKYLKATNRFASLTNHLFSTVEKLTGVRFRMAIIASFIATTPEPLAALLAVALLYVQIVYWGISVSLVLVMMMFFYRTFMRIMILQSNWNSFFTTSGALDVVSSTLQRIKEFEESAGDVVPTALGREILFQDVSFDYGGTTVINHVTCRLKKSSTTAIVGVSGAGKSTIIDLLTGVLRPSGGQLLYDGVDYRNIVITALRQQIGYVMQEIVMFNDTIVNNVSFWDTRNMEDVRERVRLCCERASCDAFIKALPQQYETVVGDRGINLSMGQRQRIAIARELYRDPSILIFDEATSALDSESEFAIQNSIESLRGSKTIIVIAHRLSTIKGADYIYVIDRGSVVEEGSFTTLYQNERSAFRQMCDRQSFI